MSIVGIQSCQLPLRGARRLLAASLVIFAIAAFAFAALRVFHTEYSTTARGATARGSAVYRDVQWEDLSPKEWDPTRRMRRPDGSLISDADPRAQAMLEDLRAIWNNAPTIGDLDGATIRLPGYVVPLDEVDGRLIEFLLVPYFGACIHTPPPPANQIVHVVPTSPVSGLHAMDTVWVSGRMKTVRQESPMGASGYRLEATVVEPYRRAAGK